MIHLVALLCLITGTFASWRFVEARSGERLHVLSCAWLPAIAILTGLVLANGEEPLLDVARLLGLTAIGMAAAIDARICVIPNWITVPGLVFFPGLAILAGKSPEMVIAGMVVGGGYLWLADEICRKIKHKPAFGWGDIKLAFCLGAFLGPMAVLNLFLLAFLPAFIVKTARSLQQIALGPYMALAAFALMLLPIESNMQQAFAAVFRAIHGGA